MNKESTASISSVVLQDLEKGTCRLCGCRDAVFLCLLKPENQSFLNLIQNTFDIKITNDDALPKNICHSCTAILHEFQKLMKISKLVQKELVNKLEQQSISKNIKYGNPVHEKDILIVGIKGSESADNCTLLKNSNLMENLCNKIPSVCIPKVPDFLETEDITTIEFRSVENDFFNKSSKITSSKSVLDPPVMSSSKIYPQAVKEPAVMNCDVTVDNSNSKDWQILTLPGNNSELYLCRGCQSILINEKAKEKHVCGSSEVKEKLNNAIHNVKRKKHSKVKWSSAADDSDSSHSSPRK